VLLLTICFSGMALATSVQPKPLEEMVREAVHVVIATVVSIDMFYGGARPVTDRDARTGPGLQKQLRFNLEVQEVLLARTTPTPHALRVPLWKMWSYTLGAMRDDVTSATGIFLLKGESYEPVYPSDFRRALKERAEIERLLQAAS